MLDIERWNVQINFCVVGNPEPDIRVENVELFRHDALLVWPRKRIAKQA
jgi:hypothetical protein